MKTRASSLVVGSVALGIILGPLIAFLHDRPASSQAAQRASSSAAVTESARQAPVPQGEPQAPLVTVAQAQARVKFPIKTPASMAGARSVGVWVPDDNSNVRIHFSNGVILLEAASTDQRPDPNGLEFNTTVNGHPALGVRGDSPPSQSGPVSQLKWWTGQIFFDLYGPISFDDLSSIAASVPS